MQLQRDESRHDFAFIAGVVVGAIAGALATLALTPMSGPETREKLREHAGDLGPVRERAASVAGAAQQRAASVAESAQQMVATGREKATDLAARSPLSVPGRGSDEQADVADVGMDTMMAENPSSSLPPHRQHAEDPAEGAADVPPTSDTTGGAALDPHETGSGRTPQATDPAEGSPEIPPRTAKPDSGSSGT